MGAWPCAAGPATPHIPQQRPAARVRDMLVKAGLIRNATEPVKVLGQGELSKKLNVTAAKFSDSAKAKITAAGGSVNEA